MKSNLIPRWMLRLGLLAAFLLTTGSAMGCAAFPNKEAEWRETVKRFHENAALRRAEHRRAERSQQELRPTVVPARNESAACKMRVRAGSKPRNGVMAVACGDFGSRWPLTVEYGFLRCHVGDSGGRFLVFTAPDGQDYALNVNAGGIGYPRMAPILDNDSKRDRSDLVAAAQELCS